MSIPADPSGTPAAERSRSLRHDLRTPLHAILGFAELLGSRPLDADARRDLEHIREAAHRLQAIVDAIP